ncbi:MAG TPA: sigma-70 family RNA polymerase sigma factor [Ignavibacteria bacterium]|nr:sigma-70 family RNA polymerase sigma factor [Ignavibacteria bacterium]
MKESIPTNTVDFSRDLNLLKLISERDSNALSKFYDIHSTYLFKIIYFIVRDESESEDILQEVFLQIWEKADSFDDSLGNPLSWVIRITRNKAIDKLRSKSFKDHSKDINLDKVFNLSEDSHFSNPEKAANLSREQIEINEALKLLNKNQRQLIEYAYFNGFTQSELSEHFKIPLGTVKTRMRSAMILLKDKLKHLI